MPPKKKSVLTTAQRKALKDATASMARAYAEARKSLAAAGFEFGNESTFCLASPAGHCEFFKPPRHGIACARPRCGHPLFRHNVF